MSTRIEQKDLDVHAHTATLLAALRGAEKREITVADAAVLTGLPLALTERALIHLGGLYESRIRVTDAGALLFTFASLEETRARTRAASALQAVRAWLRGMFDRVVAVLTYLLAPNLALACAGNIAALGLVIADLPVLLQVVLVPPVFLAFFLVFSFGFLGFVVTQFAPVMCLVVFVLAVGLPIFVLVMAVREDLYGVLIAEALLIPLCLTLLTIAWRTAGELRSGARHVVSPESLADLRAFFRGVSGFLFGPPPGDEDGLEDERRVVAFLRANAGILSAADLMALFGTTREDARREATRVLADYDGAVEVTDEGAVLFRFPALGARTDAPTSDADFRVAWEREATPPRFFDCDETKARWVLVIVTLSMLGLFAHPALTLFPTASFYRAIDFTRADPPVEILVGLGAWPFLLPCILLLARLPFHHHARRAHSRRARTLALIARAYEAARGFYVQHVDTRSLVALGGVVLPDATRADGAIFLEFPEMRAEVKAASAARRVADRDAPAQRMVFDTHADVREDVP